MAPIVCLLYTSEEFRSAIRKEASESLTDRKIDDMWNLMLLDIPRRVNLIIDIQERMAQGKGPAYERWAKVYNLKQMAAALQYLREHDLMDYDALAASAEAAVDRAHKLAGELRDTEAALSKTSELMGAVVQYAKTVSYTHLRDICSSFIISRGRWDRLRFSSVT